MKSEGGFLAEIELLLNEVMGFPAGTHKLLEICQRHAGAEIYVPSRTETYLHHRDIEIRRRYNGSNAAALAEDFGLSEKRIREIIKNGLGQMPKI